MSNNNPQFFTQWKPLTQAGKRHRSFIINSPQLEDISWNGFSRPILRADISGVKSIAGLNDRGSAKPIIAVSVVTWNPANTVSVNVPVIEHYLIRKAQSVALSYIPPYTGQRLQSTSYLYFWTAPPPFGTESLTEFTIQILAYGLENPFNSTGYLREQDAPDITLETLLYTGDYPIPHPDPSTIIYANQFAIS
jgi:hypothetical protein